MKNIKILSALLTALLTGIVMPLFAQNVNVAKQFKEAEQQVSYMLDEVKVTDTIGGLITPRTFENGKFTMVKSGDWTSGFFSGILWFITIK